MTLLRSVVAGLVAGAAAVGCSRPAATPSPVVPLTLHVTYRPQGPFPDPSVDPACPHHVAPANLTITTDWGAMTRLQDQGDGSSAGDLATPPAGRHWLRLLDLNYCGSSFGAVAPSGVSLQGVPLSGLRDVGDGTWALFFTFESGRVSAVGQP